MDARWIPVLAAALGVLGGVGGAAVGGSVANSGQSQRLQEERITEIQDLLIATYAEFQGAADDYAISWGIADPSGAWSLDGTRIVLARNSEPPSPIMVVDVVTGEASTVADGPAAAAIWLDDDTLLVDVTVNR